VCRWLNSLGLVLGMGGVVMIFFWPPPLPSFETTVPLTADGETDPKAVARNIRHWRRSRIGLGLIFLGFLAQFVASLPIGP
jgi:hypothetical protein